MNNKNKLSKRSKSLCSLNECGEINGAGFVDYRRNSRSVSESSECACAGHDAESECSEKHAVDEIAMLEKKIDKITDLFLEQCRLLSDLKEEINLSKSIIEKKEDEQTHLITELLKKIIDKAERAQIEQAPSPSPSDQANGANSRARTLLEAIEAKRVFCLDHEIRDALVDFLQSDELKNHMVSATMESLKDLVRENFSYEMNNVYLPLLRRSQRKLAKRVTRVLEEGFLELEANSASFSSSVYRISRSLRCALERHRWLLEQAGPRCRVRVGQLRGIVEGVLQKEMRQWQTDALNMICVPTVHDVPAWMEVEEPPSSLVEYPSTPQPSDPERSIIDQLMKTAEINKKIADGDVNASFFSALSSGDLSLVMAACRAVDSARLFAPCKLEQPVLLSLAQQLATDMVHETQLKCRYIEEVLINLNPLHPSTRTHLPVVVAEIRKHLTNFLTKYPSHAARRRITLIAMAADNLLK